MMAGWLQNIKHQAYNHPVVATQALQWAVDGEGSTIMSAYLLCDMPERRGVAYIGCTQKLQET